ncbi:MAG TPA: clostripain-related cysteine peptidase [Chloroflexia bacterium]|nr:clostripain-related cysteine peptidase [Chloroflexia bacterium]
MAATKAKWTFMIYLAGDNNLASAGETDLGEMRTVGSSKDVNLIAQFDNARSGGSKRFHLQKGGVGETVQDLGPTDSGDPKVLLDFVDWAVDNFPAERYALVLWNHGGGWVPSEMDRIAREVGAPHYDPREAVQRSATPLARTFFRTTLEKIFTLPNMTQRAICSDDGSGHSLDTIELGNVLAQVKAKLKKPLDLLGMDACLMSNVEVAYQARSYVDYIAASEESEPNQGWPYDTVLRKLVDNPDISTADLAKHIVQAYIKYYKDAGSGEDVTQAALDPSKVGTLASALDSLAAALVKEMPGAADAVWNALRRSLYFYDKTLWDISSFSEELSSDGDSSIKKAVNAVSDALKPSDTGFVVAESHSKGRLEKCRGVTVYVPALCDISPYYSDLDFAKEHDWLKMLEAYKSA